MTLLPPPQSTPSGPPSPATASPGKAYRAMAQFAWMSVVLSVGLNLLFTGIGPDGHSREPAQLQGGAAGLFMIVGLLCGIIALCVIPKYGRKRLLWPALSGIVAWVLLAVLAIPAMVHVRRNVVTKKAPVAQPVVLEAAKHRRSLTQFEDAELGYSFDLPSGYEAVPAASKPKQFRHVFLKPGVGESHAVILIKELGAPILANQHLKPKDLPAGTNASLISFTWRGLSVDGFRVVEQTPTEDYVTFNIQIPLRGHGLQIGFGGPGSNEAVLKAQAEQTLATLEGEVNQ